MCLIVSEVLLVENKYHLSYLSQLADRHWAQPPQHQNFDIEVGVIQ